MTIDPLRDKVEEMIKTFAVAAQNSSMYGTGHRISAETIVRLSAVLQEIFSEEEELTIGIIGDEIAYKKKPYYETSKRNRAFIEHLKEINMRKISFARGVRESDLKELMGLLLVKPSELNEKDKLRKLFASTGIEHIAIGEIGYRDGSRAAPDEEYGGGEPRGDYDDGMEFLAEAYENIKGNRPLDTDSARQLVSNMVSDIVKNKSLMLLLTSTKSHDERMLAHGVNVAVFTLIQAEALGIQKEHLREIGVAALLHDTGKIAAIRGEEGSCEHGAKLSAVEKKKKEMENITGAKFLLDMEDISVLAALVAFEHDIAYDGTGFPERLYGGSPNLVSMMIAISDQYDRMRANEDFKKDGGPEGVYEKMMEQSGKKFHPDLLSNFFALVGVYPPGTLVELNTKEVGLVIQPSMTDIRRPQIEVLYCENGEKYDEPKILNLLEKDKKGDYKWSIVRTLSPDGKYDVPNKYA